MEQIFGHFLTYLMIFSKFQSGAFEARRSTFNNDQKHMPKIWQKMKKSHVQLAWLQLISWVDSGSCPKIRFRIYLRSNFFSRVAFFFLIGPYANKGNIHQHRNELGTRLHIRSVANNIHGKLRSFFSRIYYSRAATQK